MKRLLIALICATLPAIAQIPLPQINLTGNIGCVGFPCLNSGTLIMSADADRTMTALETSAFYLKVTSSVPLTATRNLIAPLGNFPFTIENATTGGQAIQIIGTTGTGVTIPNGQTVAVWNDGTNFVQIGSAGGGIPGGSNTDVQYNNSGAFGGYPLTNFILSTGNQTITYNTNGASTLTIANPNAGSGASSGYLASNGADFLALELAGTGTSIPGAASFVISNATAPLDFQTGGGPILFNAPNTNISGALNYAADTGSANAYVVAPPSCVSATHAGTTINFKAANASTGASTLVYCTGSPVTLYKNGSTALTTGDILAGAQYSARFDGTNWQLLNSSLGGSSLPFVTILPSGDTTGATDNAAIQAAVTAGDSIHLAIGNYYLTGITAANPFRLECAGSGLTMLNSVNATTTFFTVSYGGGQLNTESNGAGIYNCGFQPKSGVTPTGGDALNISGTSSSLVLSGFHFEGNQLWGLWGGIRTGSQMVNNWFTNNQFTNFVAGGDGGIFYNTPTPGGDAYFDGDQLVGTNTGLWIAQSDTAEFTNLKINGGGIHFTQAGVTEHDRFIDLSDEGAGSGCAIDFGTGSNQPVGISIQDSQIGIYATALCNAANTVGLVYNYQEYQTTAYPSNTPTLLATTNSLTVNGVNGAATNLPVATFNAPNLSGSSFNLNATGAIPNPLLFQFFAPNTTAGAGSFVYGSFGINSSANNGMDWFCQYKSNGSATNYCGFVQEGATNYNIDFYGNSSTVFGETAAAAGPANGIAVGTTGQFQVSGAGAVTAPSIAINGGTAITSSTTANSQVVTVAAGTRALGYTTLSSGTITISNAAACTASATCVYKLTNCGTNSSAALGTLTIGTITAGTSFVINSESAAAALVTTDNSHVCWQIN